MGRLVLVPTEIEARFLVEGLGFVEVESRPYRVFKKLADVLVVSGAGKVNAALCTFWALERFEVGELWLVGIGGAYPGGGLKIGDVVCASREVYGDELFEPLEFPMGVVEGVPSGVFVTLSGLPENVEEAEGIRRRFQAVVENMEGAAVAHAASFFGVVPIEVRGISNIAGVRDKSLWDITCAMKNLVDFLEGWF